MAHVRLMPTPTAAKSPSPMAVRAVLYCELPHRGKDPIGGQQHSPAGGEEARPQAAEGGREHHRREEGNVRR
jgi:hypothetical protein